MKKVRIIILIVVLSFLMLSLLFQVICLIPFFQLPFVGYYETDAKEAKENSLYSSVDNVTDLKSITINYVPLEKVTLKSSFARFGLSVVPPSFRWEDYESYSVLLRYNNNFFYCVAPVIFDSGEKGYVFQFYRNYEASDDGIFPDSLEHIDSWPVVHRLNKIKFISVVNGISTFDTIKKLDPSAYMCERPGPIIASYHRFLDGTVMEIEYKQKGEEWIVHFHRTYHDVMNFKNILLPIDLALIS